VLRSFRSGVVRRSRSSALRFGKARALRTQQRAWAGYQRRRGSTPHEAVVLTRNVGLRPTGQCSTLEQPP
jgi:hypothetical protein